MADIKPGEQTTEYKLTKVSLWISTAMIVLGQLSEMIPALQALHPGTPWLGTALTVCGTLLALGKLLGYDRSRAAVKTTAIQAEAHKAGVEALKAVPPAAPPPQP